MRLTIALLLLVACKPKVGYPKDEVEKKAAELFGGLIEVKPDSVTCPGEDRLMGELVCVAKFGDQSLDIDVLLTPGKSLLSDGQIKVKPKDNFLRGKDVADEIIKQSSGGAVSKIDCPPITKLVAGKTFTCKATVNGAEVPLTIQMSDSGWKVVGGGDGPAPADLPMVPDPAAPDPAAPDPTTVGPQP